MSEQFWNENTNMNLEIVFIDDKQYVLSTYICTYVLQAGYTKRFLVARILEHDSSYRVIAFKDTV